MSSNTIRYGCFISPLKLMSCKHNCLIASCTSSKLAKLLNTVQVSSALSCLMLLLPMVERCVLVKCLGCLSSQNAVGSPTALAPLISGSVLPHWSRVLARWGPNLPQGSLPSGFSPWVYLHVALFKNEVQIILQTLPMFNPQELETESGWWRNIPVQINP